MLPFLSRARSAVSETFLPNTELLAFCGREAALVVQPGVDHPLDTEIVAQLRWADPEHPAHLIAHCEPIGIAECRSDAEDGGVAALQLVRDIHQPTELKPVGRNRQTMGFEMAAERPTRHVQASAQGCDAGDFTGEFEHLADFAAHLAWPEHPSKRQVVDDASGQVARGELQQRLNVLGGGDVAGGKNAVRSHFRDPRQHRADLHDLFCRGQDDDECAPLAHGLDTFDVGGRASGSEEPHDAFAALHDGAGIDLTIPVVRSTQQVDVRQCSRHEGPPVEVAAGRCRRRVKSRSSCCASVISGVPGCAPAGRAPAA